MADGNAKRQRTLIHMNALIKSDYKNWIWQTMIPLRQKNSTTHILWLVIVQRTINKESRSKIVRRSLQPDKEKLGDSEPLPINNQYP